MASNKKNKNIIHKNETSNNQAEINRKITDPDELRKKAKEVISKKTKIEDPSTSKNMQTLYELQLHQIELELQNEELLRTQNALLKSQKKYSDLYDFAPVGYFTLNNQNQIIEVNLTGARLLETERFKLINKRFTSFVLPQYKNEFYSHRKKVLISNTKETCELELRKSDGTTFFAHLESISLKNFEETSLGFRTAIIDISLRRANENEISKALVEKETLLKEIHHRVKNNLSMVISLLSLQENAVSDSRLQDAFRISINRIKSMSITHEMLYKSKNIAEIDMSEYFDTLITHLLAHQPDEQENIEIEKNLEPICMSIDEAIPLGLIFTELITNVLKYAFPGNRKGLLTIGLNSIPDAGFNKGQKRILIIRDNGVGIPDHIDINNSTTLGLNLVKILTEQLEGSLELDKTAGTQFKITF